MVEERATAALDAYGIKTARPDKNLYLKPSLGAAQKEWMVLTDENWSAMLAIVQANYTKRKKKTGPLVVELFVLAVKASSGIRRATPGRIADASRAIDNYLTERPDSRVGELSRTHWVHTLARQPEGTAVAPPESATFRQMQHLDAVHAAQAQPARGEAVTRTLTVSLNGSSPLQLTFDVQELRELLGLPSYNFLADGVFSSYEPPSEPSEDMEDTDHA